MWINAWSAYVLSSVRACLYQNELARAEAYLIVNTDNQYPKPTDGMPLRGLIQVSAWLDIHNYLSLFLLV